MKISEKIAFQGQNAQYIQINLTAIDFYSKLMRKSYDYLNANISNQIKNYITANKAYHNVTIKLELEKASKISTTIKVLDILTDGSGIKLVFLIDKI